MKIPFDIKFRPQIESGEYKVETKGGAPARIVCWDLKHDFFCLVVLVGSENEQIFQYTEKGRFYPDTLSKMDLFLITPDESEEVEDERIRKELVNFILYKAGTLLDEETEHKFIAYLEKQKVTKED